MKAFTFPQKFLAIVILDIGCFLSSSLQAQTIQIDSLITSDGEIFPFENINLISSITVEGNVNFNHDTSLVRVILTDDNGFQYMILEEYPLICTNLSITFNNHCDETCLLEQVNPNSIIIQVSNATLNLKSFYYTTEPKENASEER
jgi:hypothetical protein